MPTHTGLSSRRVLAGLAVWAFSAAGLFGQTEITSITTTFTTGTGTNVTIDGNNVTMDDDTLAVKTLTDANGHLYNVTGVATQAFIRTEANDSNTAGATNDPVAVSAWYMGNADTAGTGAPTSLLGTYNSGTPGSLLLGNNLLEGSDNLFNNVNSSTGGNDNADDVERLDMIYNGTAGVTSNSDLSIAVFDRGASQDPFEIAVITGVDSNGNPTAYGGILGVVTTSDNYSDQLLTTSNAPASVLDSGTNPDEYLLRYDSTTSLVAGNVDTDSAQNLKQNIEGSVFTMAQLGIASGTKIYGYSLMAADVTDKGNINNLVNYNNTTYFPTNTNDASGSSGDHGGLDPVAVNGVLFEEAPEPSTYGAIFLGLCVAGILIRRQGLGLRSSA